MDAPDVWVAKHDGSDIVRAAAIVGVGIDYNGNNAPSPPPCVVPAGVQAVRGHHGLPCGTRPVPAHVIGSAVTDAAAHEASLGLTSRTDRGGYIIAALRGDLGTASAPALREQLRSLAARSNRGRTPAGREKGTGCMTSARHCQLTANRPPPPGH